MRVAIILILITIANSKLASAQEKQTGSSLKQVKKEAEAKQPEHLLDGTSMNYYYQNGGGIHMEFYDGKLKYEWVVGPRKGHKNQDLSYNSRKIGDRMYIVSWLEASHPDYTTLIFNFNNNVMYSSGIFRFGTTNSLHRFYKYKNIIKNLEVNKPNQVWVSDITYIRTVKGFCYLALITDMHSRKIVGYDLSDSLELNGCVRALNKAIYQTKNTCTERSRSIKGLIHHSDKGIQYCSNQYTLILKRNKISISMTEQNHCYENAMAERVNGILKDEFYLDQNFASVAHAKRATKNAINLYNEIRLHLSLDFKTPNMVYLPVRQAGKLSA